MVCADAYRARVAAALRRDGAQIILAPSAWGPKPHGPQTSWFDRSRETGVPVVVCNRTGIEDGLSFMDAETSIFHRGRRLARLVSRRSSLGPVRLGYRTACPAPGQLDRRSALTRPPLRAAHSIFDGESLRARLDGLFEGVPAFDACGFFRAFVNDTYQLRAAGRTYYLRVYQAGWRTLAQARSEMAIIEAIAARGGRVARPVPLREGGFILELEAPEALRPAVLFEEAPGADLSFQGRQGPANAELYGRAAASLHGAMDGLPAFPDRPDWLVEGALNRPLATIGALMEPAPRAALKRIVQRLKDRIAATPDLTLALCHGDLNTSNLHFVGETGVVLDFDCSAWGWLANDIAGFARGVTLFRPPGEEADALIGAYLAGYRSVRSIAPADYEALPAFLLVQRIWLAGLHLDGRGRWGLISFGPPYVKRFSDVLETWGPILDRRPAWGWPPPDRGELLRAGRPCPYTYCRTGPAG